MDHTGLVNGDERLGEAGAQRDHTGQRQRSVQGHRLLQGQAAQVGGGQPGDGRIRIRTDHGGGEGSAHSTCGGHLPAEARAELGVIGETGVNEFERHIPPAGDLARNTCPIPPAPILARIR